MDQLMKTGPFAALSKLWSELTSAQRVVVAAFVLFSTVALIVVMMFATKTKTAVLFSGLESEDAGAIVQKLSEEKVPYKLSNDGGTIEVPANKVYDMRLKMATLGLPQGSNVGFELFDKQSFGMTEFTEKLNYQRAIQGELTRTISQLAPVLAARVHIVLPQDKVFQSDQQPTTASVVLRLRRGEPLGDEQVAGIVHLVASAVEGLKAENITIVDTQGNVLSEAVAGAGGGGGLLTGNQSKLKRQYETELSQNLQTMLAKIVGPDKAVVRVSADMSFDQEQTKAEYVDPVKVGGQVGVAVSQDTKRESYKGSVIPPNGVPGGGRGPNDEYTLEQTTNQYQVTKRTVETVTAPGKIKRLSVAVLVDDTIDRAKVASIQAAVSAAAGADNRRGDLVTVQRVAFDTASQKAVADEMASESNREMIMSLVKNGVGVILLIGFLFFLKSIVRGIKVQTSPVPRASSVEASEPLSVAPLPNPAELIRTAHENQYGPPAPETKEEEPWSTATLADKIPPEVAHSSPEDLARLVKQWMQDG